MAYLLIPLAVVVAAVCAVLIVASRRPDEFAIERTRTVAAPRERVAPLVEDFRQWSEWSPWEQLDPSMRRTYTGAASGAGSRYAWDGNKKAGAGNMEITSVSHPESTDAPWTIDIALNFTKPMRTSNVTTIRLHPSDTGTTITWQMRGTNNLMGKAMSMAVNMDKLVGNDFEKGLEKLGQAAANDP